MPDRERKSELIRIAKRVLLGKATPKEKRFLKKYYDHFDKNDLDPERLSDSGQNALENEILEKIYSKIDRKQKRRPFALWNMNGTKVAAAVAVIIVSGLIYFSYHSSSKEGPVVALSENNIKNNVITPGGNKAVLTLSNGSQVILDSAHKGMLARQGNSRIVKINNGQLIYNEGKISSKEITPKTIKYNTLTIPRGGKYRLTLPDGTKVWLNSASSLTFPTRFVGKERKVTLTGEAYFEVAKDAKRPFRVSAGKTQIDVLGTHFNVNAYTDEPSIKATLLEGSIRVTNGSAKTVLHPGQQAVMIRDKTGINVAAVNTKEVLAWKNDYFSFYRTSIYEIMRQISRWYDVDVRFEDSLNVFLNGNISREVNASEVFKMLELTGELKFVIHGNNVIVKK